MKVFDDNMSYAQWDVAFSGAAATRYHQINGQWLDIMVPPGPTRIATTTFCYYRGSPPLITTTSITTTSTTTTSSTRTATPTVRSFLAATARNVCQYANLPVMSTQPGVRTDAIIFLSSSTTDASVYSNNPYSTYQQIYGGQTCVTSVDTGQQWCSEGDNVTAEVTRSREILNIDCPGPRPPLPPKTKDIPLHITLGQSGSATCDGLVMQIGCEPGNYCFGRTYDIYWGEQTNSWSYFRYPQVAPKARIRARFAGVARVGWWIYVDGVNVARVSTPHGQWLDATQYMPDAQYPANISIQLDATCFFN